MNRSAEIQNLSLTVNIINGNGNIVGSDNFIFSNFGSADSLALLKIYNQLSTVQKARLLSFADQLNKEKQTIAKESK